MKRITIDWQGKATNSKDLINAVVALVICYRHMVDVPVQAESALALRATGEKDASSVVFDEADEPLATLETLETLEPLGLTALLNEYDYVAPLDILADISSSQPPGLSLSNKRDRDEECGGISSCAFDIPEAKRRKESICYETQPPERAYVLYAREPAVSCVSTSTPPSWIHTTRSQLTRPLYTMPCSANVFSPDEHVVGKQSNARIWEVGCPICINVLYPQTANKTSV